MTICLFCPLQGWGPKALVQFLMFLSLQSTGEALQTPCYALDSRGGRSVPNGKKKKKVLGGTKAAHGEQGGEP